MLQVSDDAKKYIESDTRTFYARLLLDSKEISGDIRSLTINKGACGSSDFAPGSVFSSYIDVTLDGCDQKLENKELTLQIGTVMESSVEWTTIGLFTVDKPSTSAYSTTFSGLGRLSSKMGGLYNPTISFPATVKTVLSEISSATGVKIDTGSLDTSIVIETKPSGYMHREMLAFIAGFYFGYATEAADGSIIIRQYQKNVTASTDGDKTTELPTFQDLDAEVTGVKVVVGTETDSDGNSQDKFFAKGTVNVAVSNPFMTQTIFNKYVDSFIGYQYRPATVNVTMGDFRLEATDALSVTDVKGVEYIVPCMSVVHTFDGGIQTTITAPAIKDSGEGEQSFRGPLSQAVSVMQAQLLIVGNIAANALTTDKADIKYAQIEELDTVKGNVETLVADNATINNKLTANEASINSLVAKDAEIDGKLTVQDASIKKLDAEKLSAEDADLTYATIESLKATDATITNLSGDYASFKDTTTETLKTQTADIVDLKANKLSTTDADIRYANIDFTNIGKAAMEYFYAQSGLIKDVTVGDQTITGELIGVTIKGDLIEGNTIVADKIVMKGDDGLYYKLNTDGATVEKEQTDYNSLKGNILQAKSVTAEKISVSDLVAFGATIGGVNIADNSIYSGVKSSATNTTRGFYLGKDGQASFGDASNYLKYFQDTDGTWKLAVSADTISFSSGQNVADALEKSVTSSTEEFYKSTSPTSLEGGSWSTTAPAWTEGAYIWRRTAVVYGDGSSEYTPSSAGVCITGNTGAQGEKGETGAQGIQGVKGDTGATGAQGATGLKALQPNKNWTGTYTTVGTTATAPTSNFNRTPVVGDTFTNLDGSSNTGTWQVTGISGTTVTFKLLSYVNSKGATGAKGDKGDTGKPGMDFSQGKMLYTDPMFNNGVNSIGVYNNASNGNVTISRTSKSSDNPISDAKYSLLISNTGSADPGLGGFYFANQTRCNAIFVYRFIAQIPSGYAVAFATNSTGGGSGEWLTSNTGDGNYREYIYRIQCGRNGNYSSTGYFYLSGTAGTSSSPVKWYLAYATCYDMTATSDVVTLNTSLTTTNESITALASRTSSVEGRISTAESSIKQNADAISLKVSQSDFNNLQVGGRNLLKKTNGNTSQTLTYPSSSYLDSKYWTTTEKLNDGYYTLSFWAKSTHAGDVVRVHLYTPSNITNVTDSLGSAQKYTEDGLCDFTLTTTMTKYWVTYSVPKDDNVRSVIIARLLAGAGSGTVTINREKLEAGTKATDWTPAPEDQVNIGDVTNQLNSELKLTGNAIDLTTGHFTVNSTNLTITSDGTLTAANGYFKGKIEATSGYFGVYDPPTDESDYWGNSYYLTSESEKISLGANKARDGSYVDCQYTSVDISSTVDGGHSIISCEGGDIRLVAQNSLTLNGTNWDTFKSQHGYDWSTFDTEDSTNTWMPVMSGKSVYHRVMPTDVAKTETVGCFQRRNKVVTFNAWGDMASSTIFNLGNGWKPANKPGVFSGFCYNTNNKTYYPVTGSFGTNGVPVVYAISAWGSANNNYVIYNSGTDRRSNFQLFVTGSWIAS